MQDGYNWGFIDWSTVNDFDLKFEINDFRTLTFSNICTYKCKICVTNLTFVFALEDQLLDNPDISL